MTAVCARCARDLPFDAFGQNGPRRRATCRTCRAEEARAARVSPEDPATTALKDAMTRRAALRASLLERLAPHREQVSPRPTRPPRVVAQNPLEALGDRWADELLDLGEGSDAEG